MVPFWIEEGQRQVQLGLLWQRYLYLLERQATSPPLDGLVRDLRQRVLEPFVRREWVPGVNGILRAAVDCWRQEKSFAAWDGPEVFRRFADVMREHALEAGSERQAIDDASDDLRACFEACWQSVWNPEQERTSGPRLARRLYFCPVDLAMQIWIQQAIAMSAWREVEPELEVLLQDSGLQEAIEDCCLSLQQFQETLACHRQAVRRRKSIVPPPGSHTALLDAAEGSVAASRSAFEELRTNHLPQLQTGHYRECRALHRRLADELVRVPAGWPPHWLMELREKFAEVHPDRLGRVLEDLENLVSQTSLGCASVAMAEWDARLGLIRLLTRRLDQLAAPGALNAEVWERLENQLASLFEGCRWKVVLVRTPDSEYADVQMVPAGQPLRVKTTGIVCYDEENDKPTWHRRAKIEAPRPTSQLVQPLRQLACAVDASDPSLAQLCRELGRSLRSHESLGSWYESQPDRPDAQTLLWRFVQRVAALDIPTSDKKRGDLAALVLDAARAEGLTFEPVPLKQGDRLNEGGPWIVWAKSEPDRKPPDDAEPDRPAVRRIAVRMPDGTLVAPSFCLTVAKRELSERPLLKFVDDHELHLAGLRIRDPDWIGWQTYNDQVWNVLCASDRPGDDDVQNGFRVFEALYAQAADSPDQACRVAYRKLTAALYRCLTKELGAELTPALNPDTLEPRADFSAQSAIGERRWVASKANHGAVVGVERWGIRHGSFEQTAIVSVSLGKDAPPELETWLQLPDPAFLGSDMPGGQEHPLMLWWRTLQRLPSKPTMTRVKINEARKQFQSWLKQPTGQNWLNDFLHMVLGSPERDPDPTARAWCSQLTGPDGAWFDCYPRIDPQAAVVWWPLDATTAGTGLRWSFNDNVSRGRALEPHQEIRFATDPLLAVGHFSLGARKDAPLLAALIPLEAVCGRLEAGERVLGDRARTLVSAVRDFEFRRTSAELRGMPDAVREPFLELLDVLTSETALSNAVRDQVLSALTDFCRETRFQILPGNWSFEAEASIDPNLPGGEIAVSAEAEQVVFHETVPLGRRYAVRLGLAEADRPVRPAEVFRSAGPEPPEYRTLLAMLDEMALRCAREPAWESVTTTVKELTQNLRDWPRQALKKDELDAGIVCFHRDYWDKLAALVKREIPQMHDRFKTCLEHVLTSRELRLFVPDNVRQNSDWIDPIHGKSSGRQWGQVSQVLRPGVLDAHNRCHLLARVIVGD